MSDLMHNNDLSTLKTKESDRFYFRLLPPNPDCEDCKGSGVMEVQQMVPVSHFQAIYAPVGPFFESQCHCVGDDDE